MTQGTERLADLVQRFKLSVPEGPGEPVNTQITGPTRVSASSGPGWDPGIYICNEFPGDADAAGGQVERTKAVLFRG